MEAVDAFAGATACSWSRTPRRRTGRRWERPRAGSLGHAGGVQLLSEQEPRRARRRRRDLHGRRRDRRARPAGCATSASGARASTSRPASTSGWTASRRRCCGSSCDASTPGTRRGGSGRRQYREALPDACRPLARGSRAGECVYHLFPVRVARPGRARGAARPSAASGPASTTGRRSTASRRSRPRPRDRDGHGSPTSERGALERGGAVAADVRRADRRRRSSEWPRPSRRPVEEAWSDRHQRTNGARRTRPLHLRTSDRGPRLLGAEPAARAGRDARGAR